MRPGRPETRPGWTLRRFGFLVALVLGVAPARAGGGAVPPVVLRAIEATDAVRLRNWAYTVTNTVDGHRSVERHDPEAPATGRWTLVSRDGRPPTPKERARHAEERRHGGPGGSPDLRGWIDLGSLRILSEDERHVVCGFRMRVDDDERFLAEKVAGVLRVLKEPPMVEWLEMTNAAPISGPAGFRMTEFVTRAAFRPADGDGSPLPASVVTRVRGRVLLLKSLDADAEVTYGDFRRVAPAP